MAMEILTLDDLKLFKEELFNELKTLLIPNLNLVNNNAEAEIVQEDPVWLKSIQVQRMLKVSPSTLQTLRKNGRLPFTKLGGMYYYDLNDIKKILENNKILMKYKKTKN